MVFCIQTFGHGPRHATKYPTFGILRKRWNASQASMEYVSENEMDAIGDSLVRSTESISDRWLRRKRRPHALTRMYFSMKSRSRLKQNKYCIFQIATEPNRLYAIFGVTIHSKSIRNVRHREVAVIASRLCSKFTVGKCEWTRSREEKEKKTFIRAANGSREQRQ